MIMITIGLMAILEPEPVPHFWMPSFLPTEAMNRPIMDSPETVPVQFIS